MWAIAGFSSQNECGRRALLWSVEARMKDSVIALVEALRLARLELHCYRDPRCAATPDWTIERLEALMDPVVGKAMQLAGPEAESPTIVPQQIEERSLVRN
jgi:hypothetical protein